MTTPKFLNAIAEGPAGTVAIRVTTAPARATSHRAIVAELAADVAGVPDVALAILPGTLPTLRGAVGEALVNVTDDQPALQGAIARLARSLDDLDAGRPTTPDRLSLELLGVVRALGEVPPARSVVARHALAHLLGVIGAVCGKLLGEARRLEAEAADPFAAIVLDPPAALVGDGEAAAPRPRPTLARVAAFVGGLACGVAAALAARLG